jgi:hypothetical protein
MTRKHSPQPLQTHHQTRVTAIIELGDFCEADLRGLALERSPVRLRPHAHFEHPCSFNHKSFHASQRQFLKHLIHLFGGIDHLIIQPPLDQR